MEFKVGDKVQIREWDDMKKEFRLESWDSTSINCKFSFTHDMRYLCGQFLTIREITNSGSIRFIEHIGWNISTDMIKLVSKKNRKGVKKVEDEKILCHECGEKINDYSYTGSDNETYCKSCFNDKFTYCCDCDEVVEIDDATYLDNLDRHVCNSCLDDNYTKCDDCCDYVSNSRINNYNNISLCNDCDYNYYTCSTCGDRIHEDDIRCDDDSGDNYCCNCYDDRPTKMIHNYDYKPDPIFRETSSDIYDPAYFGIELEVDKASSNQKTAEYIVDAMGGEDYIYCKTDGSLSCGFEIVTHPFTLDYHMSQKEVYRNMFKYAVSQGYKSHDCDTCGLHIHVGREFMGYNEDVQDLTVAKILYVFEKFWDTFVKLSRRSTQRLNDWAKRYCFSDLSDMNKNLENAKGRGRYYAVNLENDNTIEFRMFRGTLNVDTFMATIQLISTIVNKCKDLSIEELHHITFEDLIKSDYGELNSYVTKRLNNEKYFELAA